MKIRPIAGNEKGIEKSMKKAKRFLALLMAAALLAVGTAGCKPAQSSSQQATGSAAAASSQEAAPSSAAKTSIRIAVLKGPTGFGMVKLMDEAENKTAANDYTFTISGAPDDVTAKLLSGELDIAALPTNLAATLYNKTKGNIQLLALNTLGMLYVVTKGTEITSLADLKGKTIYSTGQGSLPEYALNYILAQNGIDPAKDLTIEYLSEHSELATKVLSSDEPIIAVLPQPFVTQVTMTNIPAIPGSSTEFISSTPTVWNRLESTNPGWTSPAASGCSATA